MLNGKRILIGVSGGIAAYKVAWLVRLLVKAGAQVRVVMTHAAHEFVTPLTLATLSKNPVVTDFQAGKQGTWNNHVELGLWADLLVLAPATANTLAKLAHGHCDNLLMAVVLSARCPVCVAPAMDVDMYHHASTQDNLRILDQRGVKIIPPGEGELASGLSGEGRLAEPEHILAFIEATLAGKQRLSGKRILVTAGPTFEAIDPVRFIGNHSSGKMGVAIAEKLASEGAEVCFIAGPIAIPTNHPNIKRFDVVSAQDMFDCATQEFLTCDAAILAAAVADYRPKNVAAEKIKKQAHDVPQIELEQTPDILATLGQTKKQTQVLVGFALETTNEIEHAKRKLEKKNLDFIVLNSLRDSGAGFKGDTNKITILHRAGKTINFELKSKNEVAADIVEQLCTYL